MFKKHSVDWVTSRLKNVDIDTAIKLRNGELDEVIQNLSEYKHKRP